MKRRFDEQLQDIREKILKMGALVQDAVEKSVQSLVKRDAALAQKVLESDQQINMLEVKIDEEGHELIALYQPAATDLRLLTMILKITSDLERMGDHAVNIAERALALSAYPVTQPQVSIQLIAQAAQTMLKDALTAFAQSDADLARKVLEADDKVDQLNEALFQEAVRLIEGNPKLARQAMALSNVGHNLERVADLANNIAEDVIYAKQGKEVRHHLK